MQEHELPDFREMTCRQCQVPIGEDCKVSNGVAEVRVSTVHRVRAIAYDEEHGTKYADLAVQVAGWIWPNRKEFDLLVDCHLEWCGQTAGHLCRTGAGNFAATPHADRYKLYRDTYEKPRQEARRQLDEMEQAAHLSAIEKQRLATSAVAKAEERRREINTVHEGLRLTHSIMGTGPLLKRIAEIIVDQGWEWRKIPYVGNDEG